MWIQRSMKNQGLPYTLFTTGAEYIWSQASHISGVPVSSHHSKTSVPEAHITWGKTWLPQRCQGDQVIEFFKCGGSQLPWGKLWPTESRKWKRNANKCQLTYFLNALLRCRILPCRWSKQCYKWYSADGVPMSLCGPWWSCAQHGNTSSCFPLFSAHFPFPPL